LKIVDDGEVVAEIRGAGSLSGAYKEMVLCSRIEGVAVGDRRHGVR
jgi:hypothetical protein